jgi:hypothetical protein
MRRLLIVVTAAAAAAAMIALISAPSGAQTPGGTTFTLIEKNSEGTFSFIDNPPRSGRHSPRVSGGDEFVIAQPVRDPSGNRVGSFKAHCTYVRGNRRFSKAPALCEGAYSLAAGQISLQLATTGFPKVIQVAITGGTEAYEGARGSVTSTSGHKKTTDVVHLLP